jgi:hypothetical protein
MARAILRYSIGGEKSNQSGNAVRKALEAVGFERVGTGSWELDGPPTAHLVAYVQQAMDIMKHPPGGGILDHVWVYIDDQGNN